MDTAGPDEILCIVFCVKLRHKVKSLQATVESLVQAEASASSAFLARIGQASGLAYKASSVLKCVHKLN